MNDRSKRFEIFIKRTFTENIGLKVLALVISLSLFMAVRTQERVQRWVDVEVEVVLPDDSAGLALTTRPIDTVRVHIRGRHSLVESIRAEEAHLVKMDLSERKKPGLFTFFFEPEMFNFDGVEIIDINPEAVSMRIEQVVSRRMPVDVKVVGSLAKGTEMADAPAVNPPWVNAKGPSSVIRSITSLHTEEIGIDDLAVGAYTEEVPLSPVEGLSFSRDRFKVKFEVVHTMGQRMLSGLLVRSGIDGEKTVKFQPGEVAVSLVGPQVSLNRLDPASLVPTFVLSDEQLQQPGEYRVKAVIQGLPEDIEVRAIVPSFIEVDVPN